MKGITIANCIATTAKVFADLYFTATHTMCGYQYSTTRSVCVCVIVQYFAVCS